MEYDKEKQQLTLMGQAVEFNGRDVLEIGCGDGELAMVLARNSRSYTAIDPDEDCIATALDRVDSKASTPVSFQTGSGQNLDFPDKNFDLVLFTLSLHHQESGPALEEAFRVLRPGGRVLVVEPRPDSDFQQFFHLFDDETEALVKAVRAIHASRFRLSDRGQFTVTARFLNARDLCAYDFDRDRIQKEDQTKILTLLDRLRGHTDQSANEATIEIEDRLNFFVLEKP